MSNDIELTVSRSLGRLRRTNNGMVDGGHTGKLCKVLLIFECSFVVLRL
jgi:hypothetical protein